MVIKVFKAPTMKAAMTNVKAEMGEDAVILHTKRYRKGGIFGINSKEIVEIIAAIEDDPVPPAGSKPAKPAAAPAPAPVVMPAAEKPVDIPPVPAKETAVPAKAPSPKPAPILPKNILDNYKTAGTEAAIAQAKPELGQTAQAFATALGEAISQMEPPKEPKKTPKKTERSDEEEAKDDQIQQLQDELKEMKELLAKAMTPESEESRTMTLQRALRENEVEEKVISYMTSRLSGAEIMADKNSFKAREALEKHLKKTVRVANGITLYSDKPKIVALIGPTGVGKTTTLAKIAAKFVLEQGVSAAMITADTYRISAVEQLKTYSDIIGLPLEIVYSPEALKQAIDKHKNKQLILIDTAGRSQYNSYQMTELQELLNIDEKIEKHLVLSSTTKNRDAEEILRHFAICKPDRVIFTKTDETSSVGTILNLLHRKKIALSYLTNGQSVPDDIFPASIDRLAELLLR
ncbi:MAG: flagellar biosynthesis protein FlhF [Selenomonadaceae bacterium]|nr:flagellar biosynthesis protein FlhF [Selenomonadaceae bacterium]